MTMTVQFGTPAHLAIGYIAVQVAGRMDCRPGLKAVR